MKISSVVLSAIVALLSTATTHAAGECAEEPLFINFGDLPDGSRTRVRQKVNPLLTYQGGTHFAVRAKDDNDNMYDDGIIIKNGRTSLQLAASINIEKRTARPTRNGAEIMAVFDNPVVAHSLVILDPDNDKESYVNYNDYGRIHLYGYKKLIKTIELPPNNKTGQRLRNPGNINLRNQVATLIDLEDTPGVTMMVVDTGDGGWKSIDRVKVTSRCPEDMHKRDDIVAGGPFSRLTPEQRKKMVDDAKASGKKFEFPECVGKTVAECKAIVDADAPECKGRVKAAKPRKFDFYRIWIKCDSTGKVRGVPRRG